MNLSQIQVSVRARSVLPADKSEADGAVETVVDVNDGQIIVGWTKSFGFDSCFDGDASQVHQPNLSILSRSRFS